MADHLHFTLLPSTPPFVRPSVAQAAAGVSDPAQEPPVGLRTKNFAANHSRTLKESVQLNKGTNSTLLVRHTCLNDTSQKLEKKIHSRSAGGKTKKKPQRRLIRTVLHSDEELRGSRCSA